MHLNDPLTAENSDVSSSTPQVRPESLIFTGDDDHFSTFAYRVPPGFEHLSFKVVLRLVAPCQISYSLKSDLSTQYLIAEMLYIEQILAQMFL